MLRSTYKKYHTVNKRDEIANLIKAINGGDKTLAKKLFKKLGLSDRSNIYTIINKLCIEHNEEYLFDEICENFKKGNPADILILSSICIGAGKYTLASKIRNYALERIECYEGKVWDYFYTDLIIGKLIESFEFDRLDKYLRIAEILRTPCGRGTLNRKLRHKISGTDINQSLTEADKSFARFIENKRVAIIGPLQIDEEEQTEIQSFDVLVKLNELDIIKEQQLKPLFPDVVYYTGKVQPKLYDVLASSNGKTLPPFLVGKKKMQIPELAANKVTFRLRDETNPFTLNGGLNLLPRVIADLILFKTASIKVFGVDLYTSLDFDEAYHGDKSIGWDHVFSHFINHDMITQYKFMHACYESGYIQADARLEKVMQMNLEGYLRYFEIKRSQEF